MKDCNFSILLSTRYFKIITLNSFKNGNEFFSKDLSFKPHQIA